MVLMFFNRLSWHHYRLRRIVCATIHDVQLRRVITRFMVISYQRNSRSDYYVAKNRMSTHINVRSLRCRVFCTRGIVLLGVSKNTSFILSTDSGDRPPVYKWRSDITIIIIIHDSILPGAGGNLETKRTAHRWLLYRKCLHIRFGSRVPDGSEREQWICNRILNNSPSRHYRRRDPTVRAVCCILDMFS